MWHEGMSNMSDTIFDRFHIHIFIFPKPYGIEGGYGEPRLVLLLIKTTVSFMLTLIIFLLCLL